MEPADDKEHGSPHSSDFLATATKGARTQTTLSLSRLFPYLSILGLALLYTNLALACATAFTCGKFVPTPDYLGCFRGHDRLYIVTCTYLSGVFSALSIGMLTRLRPVSSSLRRSILLLSTAGVVTLLPLLALTDEVNAVHFVSFERVHAFATRGFQVCAGVWVWATYGALSNLHSMLNLTEKRWFLLLRLAMFTVAVTSVAIVVEKQFAYSVHTGVFINENVEALLEWFLSGLAIVLLTLFSRFIRGFGLKFTVKTGDSDSEKSEVEMAKI